MNDTIERAARPDHVPTSATFEFDVFLDPALLADPHARAQTLIEDAPPLFWTPHNGGHWVVMRHEDAFRVLREPDRFSSAIFTAEQRTLMATRAPPGFPRIPRGVPVSMDPPEHTRYRAPLQKAFSPKTILALKDDIEALAESLVRDILPAGQCDFIPAVAEQFPVRVFLKMMGLPEDRLAEFRGLVREVFAPRGPDPLEMGFRLRKVADAMQPIILDRRDQPKDDLISQLWRLEPDGEQMTLELMEDYCTLLFLAGLDTVINAIGYGVRHLAQDHGLQQTLRQNPRLIPEVTEELLRRYTFVVPMRRVTQDLELGGRTLRAGDIVSVFLPAADLDAEEFANPYTIDVERENKSHMAFGGGPHRCLGSHLARIELQAIYRVVLERLPEFRLDPSRPPHFHGGNLLAVASLHLRWD